MAVTTFFSMGSYRFLTERVKEMLSQSWPTISWVLSSGGNVIGAPPHTTSEETWVCLGLFCCSSRLVALTALWSHLTIFKSMPESSAKLIRLRTSVGLQSPGVAGRARPDNREGTRRLQEGSCCEGLGLGRLGLCFFHVHPWLSSPGHLVFQGVR